MHELKAILSALGRCERAALVTLVARSGSSYRKPGARLLITDDGATLGVVSGGCVETSLHKIARDVLASGESRLATIDTSGEDDLLWGYGLGCPGILEFLVEPVVARDLPPWLTVVRDSLARRERCVVVTEIAAKPRRCVVAHESREGWEAAVAVAEEAHRGGESHQTEIEGVRAFVEVVDPPIALVVFGAADNVIPLVRIAAELGWEVTVVDRRPALATCERFPESARVIVAHVEEIDWSIVDSAQAVLLMTHHYPTDKAVLERLATGQHAYTGVVGSRRRFRQLVEEIGIEATERIFSPAGLDIGSEGPAEIALAIVAEIKAVVSGRRGTSLRDAGSGAAVKNA